MVPKPVKNISFWQFFRLTWPLNYNNCILIKGLFNSFYQAYYTFYIIGLLLSYIHFRSNFKFTNYYMVQLVLHVNMNGYMCNSTQFPFVYLNHLAISVFIAHLKCYITFASIEYHQSLLNAISVHNFQVYDTVMT